MSVLCVRVVKVYGMCVVCDTCAEVCMCAGVCACGKREEWTGSWGMDGGTMWLRAWECVCLWKVEV